LLEELAEKLSSWKTEDGLFVMHEYIGPNRFQWTPEALEYGDKLLAAIPERLRVHGVSGQIVTTMWRPELGAMIAGDPSEAIRSSEIVPILESHFQVIERHDFGGTLLHPLLADIAHNFHPFECKEDEEVLRFLFAEEQRLIREGSLSSNFTVMVLR
jgi:hypothetical protein